METYLAENDLCVTSIVTFELPCKAQSAKVPRLSFDDTYLHVRDSLGEEVERRILVNMEETLIRNRHSRDQWLEGALRDESKKARRVKAHE